MSVCWQLWVKTLERICTKFSGKVTNGPLNKWLNFGGDPDHGSGYTDPDMDPDPNPDSYRDTGKTCLCGGMHCPSASSL